MKVKNLKILIADDEPLVRKGLHFIIKKSHIPANTIIEAESGPEAIRLAEKYRPEIMLLDIKMPGCDGFQVIKQLHEKVIDSRIIIISAYGKFDYAREALRCSVCDYIVKPIQPDEVIRSICRCLQDRPTRNKDHIIPEKDSFDGEKLSKVSVYSIEDKLLDYVRNGQAHKVCYYLKKIFDALSNLSLASMSVKTAELLINCKKAACEAGANRDKADHIIYKALSQLHQCEDKDSLLQLLKETAFEIAKLVPGEKAFDKEKAIHTAKNYIQKHLSEELTLKQVAGKVFLSPSYFSNLFREVVGIPFTRYVNKLRIEHAKELLADESLSIYYIARNAGFKSVSYFTHVFKEMVGTTPGQYRKTVGK